MYYYIFEPPHGSFFKKTQNKIKNILGDLGITGEIVTPSPARTVEELTEMGQDKGYSTIVAVGGNQHINKIASRVQSTRTVLGLIPINASPLLYQLLGSSRDLREICQILKFRKLTQLDLTRIEPNKYFLTQAIIKTKKPVWATLDIDYFQVQAAITQITINRDLTLKLENQTSQGGALAKAWNYLRGYKPQDTSSSAFHCRFLKIQTNPILNIYIDDEIVGKTPLIAVLKAKTLPIITSRDKIVAGRS